MSLGSAMNTAVSALKAQSQALSLVSTNLANSSTVGYKATHAAFATMVTEASSGSASSGGVTSSARQNVSAQGLVESSDSNTDMAIDGNGMFVVSGSLDSEALYYTRNGEFDIDDDGYLTANGYYLMGWPTDSAGNVTNTSDEALEAINVNIKNLSAKATSEIEVDSNLPSTATTTGSYTTDLEVIDSLGNSHSVQVTYAKTADNTWTMSFANAHLSSDSATSPTTTGTVTPTSITLNFATDGTLTSTVPATASLAITWTTGASASSISLDLSSLSQLSSSYDAGEITQDGFATGTLEDIEIGDNGTVMAIYDNGQEMPIYKIAVATFDNYDGLTAMSNNVYAQSSDSGAPSYSVAGLNGAGEIDGNALEASTVDTSDEFTRMIVAQQAYSAASQIISTAQDMYDSLMQAVR